jgi:hypothetical protein
MSMISEKLSIKKSLGPIINNMSDAKFHRTFVHPQEMIAKDINYYRYKNVWSDNIKTYIKYSYERELKRVPTEWNREVEQFKLILGY